MTGLVAVKLITYALVVRVHDTSMHFWQECMKPGKNIGPYMRGRRLSVVHPASKYIHERRKTRDRSDVFGLDRRRESRGECDLGDKKVCTLQWTQAAQEKH